MPIALPPISLGLLGGHGPLASAWVERELLRAAARRGARADTDYPALLHVNAAMPGFSALGDDPHHEDRTRAHLDAQLRLLQAAGVRIVVSTCNTTGEVVGELAYGRGMIAMPPSELAAQAAFNRNTAAPWTVVCSRRARDTGVFRHRLEMHGQRVRDLGEDDQAAVDAIIARVMGGDLSNPGELTARIASLPGPDGGGVIIGCSELSMLLGDALAPPWICSMRETIRHALAMLEAVPA